MYLSPPRAQPTRGTHGHPPSSSPALISPHGVAGTSSPLSYSLLGSNCEKTSSVLSATYCQRRGNTLIASHQTSAMYPYHILRILRFHCSHFMPSTGIKCIKKSIQGMNSDKQIILKKKKNIQQHSSLLPPMCSHSHHILAHSLLTVITTQVLTA